MKQGARRRGLGRFAGHETRIARHGHGHVILLLKGEANGEDLRGKTDG